MPHVMHFFPLTIYADAVEEHERLKEQFVPEIQQIANDAPDSPYAWTGDVRKHGFLHLEDSFKPLIDALAPHIGKYMEALQLRTDNLDLFFQRSWPVVTRKGQKVKLHTHAQSHISLVYYLKKPTESGGIRFTMFSAPNELAPTLFEPQMGMFRIESTPINSNHVELDVEEGQVLVFPSSAMHQTLESESDEERISISADIVLMLKHDNNYEHMMPTFSKWSKIEGI